MIFFLFISLMPTLSLGAHSPCHLSALFPLTKPAKNSRSGRNGNLGKQARCSWCSWWPWWSWWSWCSWCSSCWSKYSGRLFFNKDTLAMVSRVSWVARHQPGSLDRHWSTSWGISGSADFCCQHLNSFYLRASRHCIDWCGQCLQTYLSMCIVAVTVCMKQYFNRFSEYYLV